MEITLINSFEWEQVRLAILWSHNYPAKKKMGKPKANCFVEKRAGKRSFYGFLSTKEQMGSRVINQIASAWKIINWVANYYQRRNSVVNNQQRSYQRISSVINNSQRSFTVILRFEHLAICNSILEILAFSFTIKNYTNVTPLPFHVSEINESAI